VLRFNTKAPICSSLNVILHFITFIHESDVSLAHPCNMKELKVFAGISEDLMTEVLHAGLKNDSTPESFAVKHTNSSGIAFPTQYVKIVPILWVSLTISRSLD